MVIETNTQDGLLTKKEIAQFLRLTTRSVEHWQKRGLPHFKLGARRVRYRLADVQAFLESTCKRG
jgi:excisionase family DNA binding protein